MYRWAFKRLATSIDQQDFKRLATSIYQQDFKRLASSIDQQDFKRLATSIDRWLREAVRGNYGWRREGWEGSEVGSQSNPVVKPRDVRNDMQSGMQMKVSRTPRHCVCAVRIYIYRERDRDRERTRKLEYSKIVALGPFGAI